MLKAALPAALLTIGSALVAAPTAEAAVPAPAPQAVTPGTTLRPVSRGVRVVRIAASKRGAPYRYGASGPSAFDCSGFTSWVYRHVGKRLPHNSAAQAGRVHRISRSAARPGDLVFFTDGGGVHHVAIYAGHNQVWHAPYSGARVRKERIWTSSVFFGRVR
jgi:cell wall-associated NlpC family hydrolase